MDEVFHQRDDWFEVGVIPSIRRRTIVGSLLIGLCVGAWLYWGSWLPLLAATLILAERAFEFAHIPKTKKIISSLNIQAINTGLAFRGSEISGVIIYPWSSLSYSIQNNSNGEPEAIVIEDRSRKGSKQKLVGYEGMDKLVACIRKNTKNLN